MDERVTEGVLSSVQRVLAEASALWSKGDHAQAAALLKRHASNKPEALQVHEALGGVLGKLGQWDQAGYHLGMMVELGERVAPGDPRPRMMAAAILLNGKRYADARKQYQTLTSRWPRLAEGWMGLANVAHATDEYLEAERNYQKALEIEPENMAVHGNFAKFLKQLCRVEDSLEHYRKAFALGLHEPDFFGEQAFAMTNATTITPEEACAAHVLNGQVISQGVQPLPPVRASEPERKLRLGFVSGDFRRHSVAYFLLPLLEKIDRTGFEIVLFMTTPVDDEVTQRFRELADAWVPLVQLNDHHAAMAIRGHKVDVLFDLSGNTMHTRSRVFAFGPAPVQVSYLGYANTSGMPSIGYRIVDAMTDPPGSEHLATEQLVRLDAPFLCYQPPAGDLLGEIRGRTDGSPVTFGSFNTLAKLNDFTLRLWAQIMHEVPGSTLILKSYKLPPEYAEKGLKPHLASREIDAARVALFDQVPGVRDHLEMYNRVDVALDTYPYHGTTTTCEALLMGVPVVSLHGATHASRVGSSLLASVGRADLIARSADEYVKRGVELALDARNRGQSADHTARLALRQALLGSPLCDAPAYARRFESAVRQMWRQACAAG
ncbi:MAG: tetratricopeptide repeat protein [Planctomycetes bacterium]|nr:tetratricopeptide repeat protein [Planctomycetota bacterium]